MRPIPNRPFSILTVCAAMLMSAGPAHADAASEGLSFPESVLMLDGKGFVSNLGAALDPFSRDGDGFISEIDGSGAIQRARAFPPDGAVLNAPKGLAVIAGVLYTADIDRVVGFSLETGAQVFELAHETAAPVLLNDLAATPGGELLVSDTLGGSLLAVSPRGGPWRVIASNIPGANGISVAPGGKSAIVVSLGEDFLGGTVFTVDLTTGAAAPLPHAPVGVFDGVAHLTDGDLIVSDWVSVSEPVPGRLMRLSPTGETRKANLAPDLSAPADFGPIGDAGILLLPLMHDGALRRIPLSR